MFYRSLLRFVVTHPRSVIAVALLLTVGACFFIPNIRLRLDGRSLIPAGEESLRASDQAAATFGLNDIVVLCFVGKNGMGTKEGIERIGKVSRELQEVEGVDAPSVMSITTLPLISAEGGIINPYPPIGNGKVDEETLARVRREVEMLGLNNNVLISDARSSAAIYGFVRTGADREGVLDKVEEIAERNSGGGIDIYIGGNALAQAELGRSVALDLMMLIPVLLVLLVTMMTLVFRSYYVALVSLMEIGLSLAWTIGLIGLFDQPVFITTLVLPVVLIAIGVSDDIYAINRYISFRGKDPRQSNEDVIVEAFHSVWKPILLTAFTSMAGLASLALADLEPLRVFGLFGALALGLSSLFTFTVVPAMLALHPLAVREKSLRANKRLEKVSMGLLTIVEKAGPRRVVVASVVLGIVAGFIALRIDVDDSWVQNLAPSSKVAQGDIHINEHLAGSTTVEFSLASRQGESFSDPEFFTLLAKLEEALVTVPRVGAVQSAYSDVLRILATLRKVPYAEFRKGVASGAIAVTGGDIERAIFIDESLGRPQLGRYLSEDQQGARLTAFVHGANYERLRPVFEKAKEVVASEGNRVELTPFGDGWISYLTVRLLVEGQVYSIATAALANLLLVAFMLRSFRTAFVSVLPVLIGVLFTFAALVIGDVTLGIASSMFASIALGIGIDYSIHLAAETQEECAHSRSLSEALRRAFASTGPSIILSAGVITLGFAVLLLSSVVPNRLLGVLVCISLSICGLMTLLLVPGLAEIFKLGRGIIGTGIPPATADIAGADEDPLSGVRVHKDVLSSLAEKL